MARWFAYCIVMFAYCGKMFAYRGETVCVLCRARLHAVIVQALIPMIIYFQVFAAVATRAAGEQQKHPLITTRICSLTHAQHAQYGDLICVMKHDAVFIVK